MQTFKREDIRHQIARLERSIKKFGDNQVPGDETKAHKIKILQEQLKELK